MEYRFATDEDLDLLATWNRELIEDEGHRNPMSVPELRQRMMEWLDAEYKAVVFHSDSEPLAYGLYRENDKEIYLRQFFVRRDRRRHGLGREAMRLFFQAIWPKDKRLTLEVLCKNKTGVAFWRSVGYRDYCLTLEIPPK